MKRIFGLLSILVVIVMLVSACTPATPATTTTSQPVATQPPATQPPANQPPTNPTSAAPAQSNVTLNFACWSDTIGTTDAVQTKLIDPFTAKTGIKVNLQILPWDQYWTKLQTLSATGGLPDVFCMSAAYAWEYADKKITMDLQPLFDRDFKAADYYMPVTQNMWIRYPDSTTGDLYAMPFRWVLGGLFYNKDIFDAAGVAYPQDNWTYNDMLEAAKKLTKTDASGQTTTWGMYVQPDHINLDPMIKANGGYVLDPANKKCGLTEPAAINSLQWMVDATYKYKVSPPPGLVGTQEGQFKAGVFPSGKVAMVIDGSYNIATWKDLPFKWDVVSQPAGTVAKAVYGGPDSFSIDAKTQHPDEAWKFLSIFLSPEVQNQYDVIGIGAIPFLKAAASDPKFLASPGLPAHFDLMVNSNPYLAFTSYGYRWMEWRISIMNNELSKALLGTSTAAVAAKSACTAITQTIWP